MFCRKQPIDKQAASACPGIEKNRDDCMDALLLASCLLFTVVAFAVGLIASKEDQLVQQRISGLAAGPTLEKNNRILRQKQLEGSFYERVVFPLAQKIFDKTQAFIPLSSKSWVRMKLIQAGYLKPHYQKVFLGVQLLTSCCLFGLLLSFVTLFGKVPPMVGFIISGIFGVAGYVLPMLWLMQQAKKRQDSIQKSLPDFLDLLVICVEAGLGLDIAINKISQLKSVRTSTYLREELVRYTKDIAFGKPRKESLLDMAGRTGVEDLNVIINALVQAYEMGTGVAHTLRVQSDSMRVKRLQKAEEKANKIPVKMVLPIYIFLFPAIFLTIFGPIGMILVKTVVKIFSQMDTFE
jgi:tight adherence protein C